MVLHGTDGKTASVHHDRFDGIYVLVRNFPHGINDEPSDRRLVLAFQRKAKLLVQLVDPIVAIDAPDILGKLVDVWLRLPMLSADVAHDFFDEIRHGNEAGKAAVFIQNQSQTLSVTLHLLEKLVDLLRLRDKIRSLDQRSDVDSVETASSRFLKHILDLDDSHDMIEVAFIYGHRTEPTVQQLFQTCRRSIGDIHGEYGSPRGHDPERFGIVEVEYARDHVFACLVDQTGTMAGGKQRLDVILRILRLEMVVFHSRDFHQNGDRRRQQPDERSRNLRYDMDRADGEQRIAFGMEQGHTFGKQLAENKCEIRKQQCHEDHRHFLRIRDTYFRKKCADIIGKRRRGRSACQKASERNRDLYGRKELIWMFKLVYQQARAAIAILNELLDFVPVHRNDRHFCGGKESVDQNQHSQKNKLHRQRRTRARVVHRTKTPPSIGILFLQYYEIGYRTRCRLAIFGTEIIDSGGLPCKDTLTGGIQMDEVTIAVDRQRKFFLTGTTLDVSWRKRQLKNLKDALKGHEAAILDALREDLGKSNFEGYETELGVVHTEINHMLRHLNRWTKPRRVRTPIIHFPSSSRIFAEPLGVALIMSPWNYPLQLTLAPLAAAIAAGDCAVIKPSRYSARTAAEIERLIAETFDREFITVFQGGSEMNTKLLDNRFDMIFFTGSPAVGKVVMEAAAKHITPVTLELGGKSPVIVDQSADIPLAATRIAWGKFLNAGQTCVAPDYVLVHRTKERELLSELKTAINRFYGSDPLHNDEYPKIINGKHYRRLCGLLGDGTIFFGGQQIEQLEKIAPTIMTEVSLSSPLMTDEIFGPILPVIPYDSFDEAVALIRSKEKPLALYLFTKDRRMIDWTMRHLSFGGGCINDTVVHLTNPNMHFGGVGQSGMGSYHGIRGFETFSHLKSVLKKANWLDLPIRYPPYGTKLAVIRRLMK